MSIRTSDLGFRGMAFFFRLRDLVHPRRDILAEAGIRAGDRVLDYGCGPGGYVPDAAAMVGETGRVYALDKHPLAVERVRRVASKQALTNVETIHSDCRTALPDASVDVVLLYDVFHALDDPEAVLDELHRVLKPGGTLSFSDHHMDERWIIAGVTDGHLFVLSGRGVRTYRFTRRVSTAGEAVCSGGS